MARVAHSPPPSPSLERAPRSSECHSITSPAEEQAPARGAERPLVERYAETRQRTERLCEPLSDEDQLLQSMPAASPVKWHRAHTTWFFEAFVLSPRGVRPVDERYGYLFNSYYDAVGARHPRPLRGLLSRPTAREVTAYRREVDRRMVELLGGAGAADLRAIVELGLAHEEQHQELVLTDVLHAFSKNVLGPRYREMQPPLPEREVPRADGFTEFEGGLVEIGAQVDRGAFAFDNELPAHRVWLEPYAVQNRAVTVEAVVAFIRDGGYRTPSLWLSDGLDFIRRESIEAPLHLRVEGEVPIVFGPDGWREADLHEPAAFLSFFEADALARYLGGRLPTEAEWENAARLSIGNGAIAGTFVDDPRDSPFRPLRAPSGKMSQLFGDVWEWTRSAYEPYPGFSPAHGAAGEYNGKFMANQFVLRGGSCFTPRGHVRASYRNFWAPDTRFQMAGLRLARDLARSRS